MLNHITDDQLRDMYWNQHMSGREIAALLGCTPAAVSMRMKSAGIKARHASEYPPTEKQRAAWRENGHKLGISERSREAREKISRANKGRRKRDDYEFGGHEKKRPDGYIKVYSPDHPHATADGYVMKHVLVMERHIGRYLTSDEVVHHVNHIRSDNRLDNLRLMTKHDHASMHMRERHEARRAAQC